MVHPRTFSPGPVAVVDQTLLLTVCWTSFESRATFCDREQTVHPLCAVNEKVKEDGRPQEGATAGKLAVCKSLLLTWGNLNSYMSLFPLCLCFGLCLVFPSCSSPVPSLPSCCFNAISSLLFMKPLPCHCQRARATRKFFLQMQGSIV